jgi:molecular chaperone GrpE
MTAIKIPVRVIGTSTKRRDPAPRPEAGRRPEADRQPEADRRPEADPEPTGSETVGQSSDPVSTSPAETAEECACAPADRDALPEEAAPVSVAETQVAATQVAATRRVAAAHQATEAQDRLLIEVLSIADNLERALAVAQEDTPIRQGVAITHRDLVRLLQRHGLERIDAFRQPFDPQWHEAIDVVPARELGVAPGTVVQVMVPGYRRGEQLFRPARVVVAQ